MKTQKVSAETVDYEHDVILWAELQARLLRAGRFDELDIEHIADEIEDVGRSVMRNPAWQRDVWLDARAQALREMGIDDVPETAPFTIEEAQDPNFWPD